MKTRRFIEFQSKLPNFGESQRVPIYGLQDFKPTNFTNSNTAVMSSTNNHRPPRSVIGKLVVGLYQSMFHKRRAGQNNPENIALQERSISSQEYFDCLPEAEEALDAVKEISPCTSREGISEDFDAANPLKPSSQTLKSNAVPKKPSLGECVHYFVHSEDGTADKVVIAGNLTTRRHAARLNAATYFKHNEAGEETGCYHIPVTQSQFEGPALSAYRYIPDEEANFEGCFNDIISASTSWYAIGAAVYGSKNTDSFMVAGDLGSRDVSADSSCKTAQSGVSSSLSQTPSQNTSYLSTYSQIQSPSPTSQLSSSLQVSQTEDVVSAAMWSPAKMFEDLEISCRESRQYTLPELDSSSCSEDCSLNSSLSSVDDLDILMGGSSEQPESNTRHTEHHFVKFIPVDSLAKSVPNLLVNKRDKKEWHEAQAAFVKHCQSNAAPSLSDNTLLARSNTEPVPCRKKGPFSRLKWSKYSTPKSGQIKKKTTGYMLSKAPHLSDWRFSKQLNESYIQLHTANSCINYSAVLFAKLPTHPNFDLCHVKTELLVAAMLNFFSPYSDVQCLWIKNLHEKVVDLLKDRRLKPLFSKLVFLRHFDAVLVLSNDASKLLRHRDTCFVHSLTTALEIQPQRLLILHKRPSKHRS